MYVISGMLGTTLSNLVLEKRDIYILFLSTNYLWTNVVIYNLAIAFLVFRELVNFLNNYCKYAFMASKGLFLYEHHYLLH